MIIPQCAHAGWYSVSYSSGGSVSVWNDSSSVERPYTFFGGGGEVPFSVSIGSLGEHAHARNSNGTITATFTWHGTNSADLPPKCAVLVESGGVAWNAAPGIAGFDAGSGSSDDGLAHAPVGDPGHGQISSGTKYTVIQNPGMQKSITCTQSVNVDGIDAADVTISLSYEAALYAIWIDTTNTVNEDENIYAEAGRYTRANLSCACQDVEFSNYSWSATGSLFSYYAASNAYGHVVNVPATEWSSPAPTWTYKCEVRPAYIYCTATIKSLDGKFEQSVSTDKTLIVESAKFVGENGCSEKSYYDNWANIGLTNTLRSNGKPTFVDPVTEEVVGMYWKNTSGSEKAPHFPPEGELIGTQLINNYWAWSTGVSTTNGEYMLDTSFPYNNVFSITDDNNGDTDTPSIQRGGVNIIVQTDFDTFVLYRPRSDASDYIPLKHFEWTWNTSASTWEDDLQPSCFPFVKAQSHPEWDHRYTAPGNSSSGNNGGDSDGDK